MEIYLTMLQNNLQMAFYAALGGVFICLLSILGYLGKIRKLKNELIQAQFANDKLQIDLEEKGQIENELLQVRTQAQQDHALIATLTEAAVGTMSVDAEQFVAIEGVLPQHEQVLKQLLENWYEQQTHLQTVQTQLTELKQTFTALEAAQKQTEAKLSQAELNNQEYQASINELESAQTKAVWQLNVAEQKISELTAELEARGDYQQVVATLEKVQASNRSHQTRISHLQLERMQLVDELNATKKAVTHLEEQLASKSLPSVEVNLPVDVKVEPQPISVDEAPVAKAETIFVVEEPVQVVVESIVETAVEETPVQEIPASIEPPISLQVEESVVIDAPKSANAFGKFLNSVKIDLPFGKTAVQETQSEEEPVQEIPVVEEVSAPLLVEEPVAVAEEPKSANSFGKFLNSVKMDFPFGKSAAQETKFDEEAVQEIPVEEPPAPLPVEDPVVDEPKSTKPLFGTFLNSVKKDFAFGKTATQEAVVEVQPVENTPLPETVETKNEGKFKWANPFKKSEPEPPAIEAVIEVPEVVVSDSASTKQLKGLYQKFLKLK